MSRYETLHLLRSAPFDQLISAFRDGTLERLVPGASALDSCSQITRGKHLDDAAVQLVTGSRYSPNLAVLQRADAMSSWTKPDGSEHAMVRWWYAKPVG